MKKLFFLILTFVLGISTVMAKEDSEKRDQRIREMKEFKMKYLAKEMDLTDSQKQRFFELYDEMGQKLDACYKTPRDMERRLKKQGKEASEEDYQKVTEAFNQANVEGAEIEKTYNEKFVEFLSSKQIYKLKEAEKNFRERLEEMRHKRKKEHKKK